MSLNLEATLESNIIKLLQFFNFLFSILFPISYTNLKNNSIKMCFIYNLISLFSLFIMMKVPRLAKHKMNAILYETDQFGNYFKIVY